MKYNQLSFWIIHLHICLLIYIIGMMIKKFKYPILVIDLSVVKLSSIRTKRQEKVVLEVEEHSSMVLGDLQIEVFGLKKSGSKRFSWGKLGWKASDQDECAVCLDHFKAGQTLMHLPCAHRFHSRCLAPWLENNAHCPCCRMGVLT